MEQRSRELIKNSNETKGLKAKGESGDFANA
jgi:hypothetical protein